MSTALVASPNVAINGAGSFGQPHDPHSISDDSDNGTCPAPGATLDVARGHETHHKGGDVSADYHEQEGADTEVGKGEEDANTDGPILVVVMVRTAPLSHIYDLLPNTPPLLNFCNGHVCRVYPAQESPRSAPRWRLRSDSRSPTRTRCTPRPISRR